MPKVMNRRMPVMLMSCAAAVATQRVLAEEGLVANSAAQGARLMRALDRIREQHGAGVVRDVRGLGCMVGLELAASQPQGMAKRVTQACHERARLDFACEVFGPRGGSSAG